MGGTKRMLRKPECIEKARRVFQLFYLRGEDETVEVEEVDNVDFAEIEIHLEKGESIFITHKPLRKLNMNLIAEAITEEPWYFTHA